MIAASEIASGKNMFMPAGPSLAQSIGAFWKFLAALAFFALVISWLIISRAAEDQKEHMFFSMHARAESLGWAVEASARFFRQRHCSSMQPMLLEISRQPGVAWLAFVDASGRIISDSNAGLDGKQLYTPAELEQLQPSTELKGRFSPDDPNIYETWRLFAPYRISPRQRHHRQEAESPVYLFIALDATDFKQNLHDYVFGLALIAGLTTLASLCLIALVFYIYNFRQSRKTLAITEALALRIIENYPGALLVTDTRGQITFCNDKGREFLNIPRKMPLPELSGLTYYDWDSLLGELAGGNTVLDRDAVLRVAGDMSRDASISAVAIYDVDAEPCAFLFVIRDMDEINLLKRRLARSERLSAAGRLAAGLAHEIRNPLSSIRGYARYLEARLKNDQLGQATAKLLDEETGRINNVLTDLLTLARPPELHLKRQPLQAILKKAMLIAKPDADAKNIRIELDMTNDESCLPEVDSDRLLQAILNLTLNAVQAVKPGGSVCLRLARGQKNPHNSEWIISVEDNGPGMSEKIRGQIFTPYFTTKESGTGLGLAITRQIVESHNGEINVASAPGKGAIFTISIPVGKIHGNKKE